MLWIYGSETGGPCLAAMAALASSNRTRYRQTCEMFLDELEQVKEPRLAEAAAWAAAVAPEFLSNNSIRLRLAKRAIRCNPSDLASQRTYGAVLYRDGDFQGAVDPLGRATASETDSVRITAALFLAMAYHHAGRNGEARLVFDRMEASLKNRRQTRSPATCQHLIRWDDDVVLSLLYDEASATLKADDRTDVLRSLSELVFGSNIPGDHLNARLRPGTAAKDADPRGGAQLRAGTTH